MPALPAFYLRNITNKCINMLHSTCGRCLPGLICTDWLKFSKTPESTLSRELRTMLESGTCMEWTPSLVATHFWLYCSPLIANTLHLSVIGKHAVVESLWQYVIAREFHIWQLHPLNSLDFWTVSLSSKTALFRKNLPLNIYILRGSWSLMAKTPESLGYPPTQM